MKKQLLILAASTLLLASCKSVNSVKNDYRKKIGSSVEYSEFVAAYTSALADIKSGEFWDLIDAGTPKSGVSVSKTAELVDVERVSKAGKERQQYSEYTKEEVKYDEKNETSSTVGEANRTNKKTFNNKVLFNEEETAKKSLVASKQYLVDKCENTYKKGTFIPAGALLDQISTFFLKANASFGADADYVKWNVNGSLFTCNADVPANLYSSDFSENDTFKSTVQVNIDPNDMFIYRCVDLSGISYTDADDAKVSLKKYVTVESLTITSKDVTVKLPDLAKYVNEDYADL